MEKGTIQVICGTGTGKTNMAFGAAVRAASAGSRVVFIQFLKGSQSAEAKDWLKKMEPDLRVFSFEKSASYYEALDEEAKEEEKINIRNGLAFAKKVISTGECDLLVLDEFLGILDHDLVPAETLDNLSKCRDSGINIILTGIKCPEKLFMIADSVVSTEKRK
jgi:cob(I)alamin adenosyltransferase